MGKHNNYTNYRNMRNNEPAKEEVVEEVVEVVEETVDAEPVEEVVEEVVEEKAVEEKVESDSTIGVVNCTRLNVRVAPNTTATVVCEVTKLSELRINETNSTDDWYNVITASGVSGYCMKAFVTVK